MSPRMFLKVAQRGRTQPTQVDFAVTETIIDTVRVRREAADQCQRV